LRNRLDLCLKGGVRREIVPSGGGLGAPPDSVFSLSKGEGDTGGEGFEIDFRSNLFTAEDAESGEMDSDRRQEN
jgi:hypothetical protein